MRLRWAQPHDKLGTRALTRLIPNLPNHEPGDSTRSMVSPDVM